MLRRPPLDTKLLFAATSALVVSLCCVSTLPAATCKNAGVNYDTLDTDNTDNILDSYPFGDSSKNCLVGETANNVSLLVTNAGTFTGQAISIGDGYQANGTLGSHNSVTVDASTMTASGDLKVGYFGSDNSLTIRNGATVTCASASSADATSIGYGYYTSSNNADGLGYGNRVTVTGSGSTWTVQNMKVLYVGRDGCSNKLEISDGGAVVCSEFIVGHGNTDYGSGVTGGHNSVTVGGTTSSGASKLTATTIVVGGNGSDNSLTIQNGANVTSTYGVTLGFGIAYYNEGTSSAICSKNEDNGYGYGNTLTVTGQGSTLTLKNSINSYQALHVGFSGCSNKMTVSDGGSVVCGNMDIGTGYGIHEYSNKVTGGFNSLTLTGTGSSDTSTLLMAHGNLFVGLRGSNNALTIQSGADVTNTGEGYIGGYDSNASNNTATVTGTGSTWILSGNLTIGLSGDTGNILTVADGALVKVGGVITVNTPASNYIQLNDGYLAVAGDYSEGGSLNTNLATLLSGIDVYVDGSYTQATTSNTYWKYISATEAAAYEAVLGYSDLGYYTILSSSPISVPEPSVWTLFGGAGAFGLGILLRRVRKRSKQKG